MSANHELLAIGHADLIENVRQMTTDRTVTNRQFVGDFLVRESASHQTDNLALTLGQSLRPHPGQGFGFTRLREEGAET